MPLVINSLDQLRDLTNGEIGVSPWLEVTQTHINSFATLTGDEQWIHTDPARAAAESPFKTTIAHGFFTLSLLPQLAAATFQLQLGQSALINYGLNRVRFPAPTPSGVRLRARFTLHSATPKPPSGLEIIWQVTVEAEGSPKPVCAAEWVTFVLFGQSI